MVLNVNFILQMLQSGKQRSIVGYLQKQKKNPTWGLELIANYDVHMLLTL